MLRIDRPGGVELYLEHVGMPESAAGSRLDAYALQQQVKSELIARRFGSGASLMHTPEGAPRIEGAELNISLSHCAALAAMAVCPKPGRVGVDAEGCDRYEQLTRISRRFLSKAEWPLWSREPQLLLAAWVLKEALYKAAGHPGWALADIPVLTPEAIGGIEDAEVECFGHVYVPEVFMADGFDGLVGLAREVIIS